MKKILMIKTATVLLITLLSLLPMAACENIGEIQVGCISGIIPGSNTRIFLQCTTRDEYAVGGNMYGGVAYDNILWTPVEDCNECLTLDYDNL